MNRPPHVGEVCEWPNDRYIALGVRPDTDNADRVRVDWLRSSTKICYPNHTFSWKEVSLVYDEPTDEECALFTHATLAPETFNEV